MAFPLNRLSGDSCVGTGQGTEPPHPAWKREGPIRGSALARLLLPSLKRAEGYLPLVFEATLSRLALASAIAFALSAFACDLHALLSAPFMSSHFSWATS